MHYTLLIKLHHKYQLLKPHLLLPWTKHSQLFRTASMLPIVAMVVAVVALVEVRPEVTAEVVVVVKTTKMVKIKIKDKIIQSGPLLNTKTCPRKDIFALITTRMVAVLFIALIP